MPNMLMKGAIETFMAMIMITIMVAVSTCYITASLDLRHAQNFHSMVVSEIEASNHAESVITDCKSKATENGFTAKDGSGNTVSGLTTETIGSMGMTKVTLHYNYTIPFLNIFLDNEIVGYAR